MPVSMYFMDVYCENGMCIVVDEQKCIGFLMQSLAICV